MKKQLFSLAIVFSIILPVSAQRFVTEVFPSFTETSNITYATNISVLTGTPTSVNLAMDVYQPAGITDTMARRPLIIFLHEGSCLPPFINQEPTGSRNDSANVEMCERFARRGYVVANIDYRLGWNPAGSTVDIRRGTLINALFRAVQDAKSCVRYFRKDAATANLYMIDSNRIILGGASNGGTVAVNYACLQDSLQLSIPKYISSTTVPAYGFVAGQPYVSFASQGDQNGYGGIPALNNSNNSPGYGNNVQFVFSLGSVLGDSTWLTAGDAPMVAFHNISDPFTPYGNGIVYVPSIPPQSVVAISGSGAFIPMADQLGNNDCFNNPGFKSQYASDPYTIQANTLNGGHEGLYPFASPVPETSPWDWFDSVATVDGAVAYGLTVGAADTIYANALLTNPDMSKIKAMKYIDTIMGYLNPRIAYCLGLIPGLAVNNVTKNNHEVNIFPNPVTGFLVVKTTAQDDLIRKIDICDLTGRSVMHVNDIDETQITLRKDNIPSGVYLISIFTTSEKTIKKLVVQ